MTGVVNLETLVQQGEADPAVFGSKAASLVKLATVLPRNLKGMPVIIPSGFCISVETELDHPDISDTYHQLTQAFATPQIILARSSDPNEVPGKFETHVSLFDPNGGPESFKGWLTSAERVRESGASGVMGQVLGAQLDTYRIGSRERRGSGGESESEDLLVETFGGTDTGIVCNSTNFLRGNQPVVVAARGLASKIVRGDQDVSVIQRNGSEFEIINLAGSYTCSSGRTYVQNRVDAVLLNKPNRIVTLKSGPTSLGYMLVLESDQLPFDMTYRDPDGEEAMWGPGHLLDVVSEVKARLGTEVELEGSVVNDHAIYFVQLREYRLPQRSNVQLAEVGPSDLIAKTEQALSWQRLNGDLYVGYPSDSVPRSAICAVIDSDAVYESPALPEHPRLLIPMFSINAEKHMYPGSHNLGRTVQTLVEMEREGTTAIATEIDMNTVLVHAHSMRQDRVTMQSENRGIIRDVTVECDGTNAQIYFN